MPRHAGTWTRSMRGASHPELENTSCLASERCRCGEKRAERKRQTKGHEDRIMNVTQRRSLQPLLHPAGDDGAEGRDVFRLVTYSLQLKYGNHFITFVTPAPPPPVCSHSSIMPFTEVTLIFRLQLHIFYLFNHLFQVNLHSSVLVLLTSAQFWITTDENVLTAARSLLLSLSLANSLTSFVPLKYVEGAHSVVIWLSDPVLAQSRKKLYFILLQLFFRPQTHSHYSPPPNLLPDN